MSQVAGSRKISIDPLQSLGKAASHDLPGDISLSSEAEEMIAAWNGGKSRYDDGEKPAASHAEDELSLQGQHTGEMAAGGRRQVWRWHCMLMCSYYLSWRMQNPSPLGNL